MARNVATETYLIEMVGGHIAHSPTFIGYTTSNLLEKLLLDLSGGHAFRDNNQILYRQ